MIRAMTIAEVNAMGEDEFLNVFGNVYEHSDWVAEMVLEVRPFEDFESLIRKMAEVIAMAGPKEQLEMLMCYPDPGGEDLTEFSKIEQAEAGLDQLDTEETELFTELIQAYRGMVGLPFIVQLAGMDKAGVLRALGERLLNPREMEFRTAMAEMHAIARHRIEKITTER